MTWYQGKRERPPEQAVEIPRRSHEYNRRPEGYLADDGLVDAVNVALHLDKPLLLTGQPGTGKTQLAYSLAWQLGLGEVLKFNTKSTSTARDLFYTYDALGRFHAVHNQQGSTEAIDYITWNAFGKALIHANAPNEVKDLLPEEEHPGQRRSLVLIDEIDKAPRDFPNDLLNEVENMCFTVPELGHREVTAEEGLRPVVVMTSNSEKNLAEAFLRRCIFYNIPFPGAERLETIVNLRLGEQFLGEEPLKDALDLFHLLRRPDSGLGKKPSTGELLDWLQVLEKWMSSANGNGVKDPRLLEPTLSSLVKTIDDREQARRLVEKWIQGS